VVPTTANLGRMADVDTEWVSRAEAQRLLGLGRAQVDNLRRSGELESVRNAHTGRVSIRMDSIKRMLRLRSGAE
jgi:hypothetical protein